MRRLKLVAAVSLEVSAALLKLSSPRSASLSSAQFQTDASHFVLEFGEAAFTSPNVVSSYAADGCEAATSEIGDLRRIRKPSASTRGKMRR